MKNSLQMIIIFTLIFGLTAIGFTTVSSTPVAQPKPATRHNSATEKHSDQHDDHNHNSREEHSDHDDHDGDNRNNHPESHQEHNDHDKHADSDAGEAGHDHDHEEGEAGVKLSPAQLKNAGIKVAILEVEPRSTEIYAPGELKANDYTSYLVAPRTDSIVLKRHVALGDHIEKGQPLVTLFADSVAAAQVKYLIAREEWQRVRKLGRRTVGAKRYIAGEMDYKAAESRLKIFGLSTTAIKNTSSNSATLGEYTLNATINGTVLEDDFQQGQRVAAGEALLQLVDERNLRVEAYLAPNLNIKFNTGTLARIKVNNRIYPATISQQEHTIDPRSRTQTVRLLVDNEKHHLHPGLFVDVYFSIPGLEPVLAVPETALMRGGDGDWTVFVEEEAGEYQAHEVDRGRTFGDLQEITGIAAGSRVVIEGAFFIASQLAKGGFDPHNH